ncbi:MAG: hypothetical protein LBB83_10400 [Treponema sp.]|nr:hypothetical protein [Treponema sp.]
MRIYDEPFAANIAAAGPLGVCRAARIKQIIRKRQAARSLSRRAHKTQKIVRKAIFYPANSHEPKVRDAAHKSWFLRRKVTQKPTNAAGR